MKHWFTTLALGCALTCGLVAQEAPPATAPSTASEDPFQWLEGVTDEKALAWVKERNAASAKELATQPAFGPLENDLLKILDSTARIPYVSKHGADVRYYENIEGGHGGAANNRQAAHMTALAFTFLWQQLK